MIKDSITINKANIKSVLGLTTRLTDDRVRRGFLFYQNILSYSLQ